MATTLTKKLTYADYLQLTPPDSAQYQLIEGELIAMTSPSTKHQAVLLNLAFQLQLYLKTHNIGKLFLAPMDVVLEESEVYQPDLFFIANENKNIIQETKIQGAPNVIIEILSPSNAYYDLVVKKRVYERCGVNEYWVVDPNLETLDLYILKNAKFEHKVQLEKEGQIPSQVFTELNLDLKLIFE